MVSKRDNKGRFITSSAGSAPRTALSTDQGQLRVMSDLLSRMQLANLASLQFEGNRDMYAIFGYKKEILPQHTLAKYTRQDIATRIVDAPPDATWSNPPTIKSDLGDEDNPTNVAFQSLAKRTKLWSALHRADRMARMYPFSIVLFGFDDGGSLARPINGKANDLLYVRAYGSRQIDKLTFNTDP